MPYPIALCSVRLLCVIHEVNSISDIDLEYLTADKVSLTLKCFLT